MMQVPDDLRKVGLYRTIPSRVFGNGNISCLQLFNDEFWLLVSEKFCKQPEATQTITKPTVPKTQRVGRERGLSLQGMFETQVEPGEDLLNSTFCILS
jgi:hypothetical protein